MSDGCRLFVYGISENVQRDELEQEFGRCGSVTDAYNTGKGYAFITYSTPEEAQDCVSQMSGQEICGQQIKIDVAKGSRDGGGGGGGRGGGRGRGGGYGGGRGGGGYGGGRDGGGGGYGGGRDGGGGGYGGGRDGGGRDGGGGGGGRY